MGEKGLARRGWLVKMGQKLYALTRDGRQVVRRVLLEEEEEPTGANVKAEPGHGEIRHRPARQQRGAEVRRKPQERFDFHGRLPFLGHCRKHERATPSRRAFNKCRRILAELDRSLADVDAELSTGRIITAGDVRILTHVHRYMEDRFDRHLNLLRTRAVKH